MSNRILLSILAAGLAVPALGAAEPAPPVAPVEALTLEAAVRAALERAPEVALARSGAERAGAAVGETRSLNRPQIVSGTGLAYNNGYPLSLEGSAPSLFQVGVSQALLSKRNTSLIREAEENLRATQAAPEEARNEVAARVALLYDELHRARKLEALWGARADAARRSAERAAALQEAGKARPVDLAVARAATAGALQQQLAARERAVLAEAELVERLGLRVGSSIRTSEPRLDPQTLDTPGETLYQRALEVHPGVRQAEHTLRARELHVEAERGESLPRLELVSEYALFSRHNNYSDFFNRFSRHNYLLGLSVQVPIFTGGRTGARVAASRHESEEARLRLERQKTDLRLGIGRGASRLRVARGAVEVARLDAAAAGESLKVQESLFEAGRIPPRDVDLARGAAHEKELAVLEAEGALWQSEVELLRVAGLLASLF